MSKYWRKRELKHIDKMIKDDKKITKRLARNQTRAMNDIQTEIDAFHGRYAAKEGISMNEARKRATKLDIGKYEAKAKRYVKEANEIRKAGGYVSYSDFSDRVNEEMRLYNMTMKTNRLELLKANINLELVAMTNEEQHILLESMTKSARAEFKRQSGILGMTIQHNEKMLADIVNSSFLNTTWSHRLWDNQDALRSELDRLLNRGIVQGLNPRELASNLRGEFDTSIYNSERLMRTEMARVQADVFTETMNQADFDAYEYIAEPTACPICAALDGQVFDKKDMTIGVNMYPMHPNCMCATANAMSREAWDADLKERGL